MSTYAPVNAGTNRTFNLLLDLPLRLTPLAPRLIDDPIYVVATTSHTAIYLTAAERLSRLRTRAAQRRLTRTGDPNKPTPADVSDMREYQGRSHAWRAE